MFGQLLTLMYVTLFLGLVVGALVARKELAKELHRRISARSLVLLAAILVFFVIFLLTSLHPAEQLYFDENIYQGIALNILKHGSALWCQAGTGYLNQCFSEIIYHDPTEYSFYIAMAFAAIGISPASASSLQLLIGALSIVWVFVLAAEMFDAKTAVASALAFAAMPQLMIWSRTYAVIDLPFMSFATLAVALFVMYRRSGSAKLLIPTLSALGIAACMRIEGVLLLPLFFLFYLTYGDTQMRKRLFSLFKSLRSSDFIGDEKVMLLLALGVVMLPQIYLIGSQLHSPDYGQSGNNASLFSVKNFISNAPDNLLFFTGYYNSPAFFPTLFLPETSALALLGIIVLALGWKGKNRIQTLLLLLAWIIVYMLFYDFFYAGSAIYGVDVRFMLQLLPAIAIFAGMAISGIAEYGSAFLSNFYGVWQSRTWEYASFAALSLAFIALPFYMAIPSFAIQPSAMPQQGLALGAVAFIYSNGASVVPRNCTVFSQTPDIWYEIGVDAAATGQLPPNGNIGNNCAVYDYGYWCMAPVPGNNVCNVTLSTYKAQALLTQRINGSYESKAAGIYRLYDNASK